jgi:sulfur carrier protein ThiS adenylyltransferase
MGVTKLALFDFDEVDETNICTQGYKESQMGEKKVLVMKGAVEDINSEAQVGAMCVKFTETSLPFFTKIQKRFKWDKPIETVFCCVDSITARERIFEAVKDDCKFFVDGRMTAESLRVLTVTDDKEYYPTTIFPQEEAMGGTCTAKSTIYCANIAAGMMCSQYTKYLRGFVLSQDLLLNIFGEVLETV